MGAKGKPISEEGRANISRGKKGRAKSQAFKDRMRELKTGVPRDEETKSKISAGKLKYQFTEAHLQHIREGNQPKHEKVCEHCGQPFIGRGSQRFCCKEHQKASWLKRRDEAKMESQ